MSVTQLHATRRPQLEAPPRSARGPGAPCRWCARPIPRGKRRDALTCSKRCRQADWRFRVERCELVADEPMSFAYADPPYPGKAGYYVERQEVDHVSLLEQLTGAYPHGWALSTSSDALRDVLAICPPAVRVCVWRRRVRPTRSRQALSAWEPLIVCGGRPLDTTRTQTLLDVLDYRGRYSAFPGALTGMKPPQFAAWMFNQLGARRGDSLADLYPGSGAITAAWAKYVGVADASRGSARDLKAIAA